jgi:hypothetical protein
MRFARRNGPRGFYTAARPFKSSIVQEFKVTDLNTFKTFKPFNRFTRFKTLEEENTDSMVLSVPAVAELKQFQS